MGAAHSGDRATAGAARRAGGRRHGRAGSWRLVPQPPAPTTCSTGSLAGPGPRKLRGPAARTGSAPCRTTCSSTFLASSRRRRRSGRACSPGGWCHLWKSTRRLRISPARRLRIFLAFEVGWKSARDLNKFVNHLLLLRDPDFALDEVSFTSRSSWTLNCPDINNWIRHILQCQASVLIVRLACSSAVLDGPPLVSQHLRSLELHKVEVNGYRRRSGVREESNFLDLSSCPVLEDLNMTTCQVYSEKILSHSVKRLSIGESSFMVQARISVPTLVWLKLECFCENIPLLETMPFLETALIKLFCIRDRCDSRGTGVWCGACAQCRCNAGYNGPSLLFGGLSSSTNVELITFRGMTDFRRNLKWCPTFSELKTLLLKDWGVAINFHALVCILKHSPVLEMLVLQLSQEPECAVESEQSYHPTDQSCAVSAHLKIVEIKCEEVDGRVRKISEFLSRFISEFNIVRTGKMIRVSSIGHAISDPFYVSIDDSRMQG
ncbi:hypothetical protein ACP70R_003796 [Stipagrostis hirtigluma subsp. patula]